VAGKIVVVNISRAVIGQVRAAFHRSRIVLVRAPLEMRAQRIARRGRENESDIRARLARTVDSFAESDADLILDNSGTPEDAARTLLDFLVTISPQIEA
jgi:ribose 1,5-bisphosphokinase PhnN